MFKFLKLFFDEVDGAGEGEGEEKEIYDPKNFDQDAEEKKFIAKVDGEEVVEEEVAEEEVVEEETTGDEEVVEEEVVEEEVVEEEETPEVTKQRLKDTQTAYHEGQKQIKELTERMDKYEKKLVEKEVVEEKGLTLENIDPKVLADSWAKDPVNTMRWVTDQQAKMTFKTENKRLADERETGARDDRIESSEKEALIRFPVLAKIIKMEPDVLKKLKTDSPEQYEFASKTLEYQDVFEKRGDEEALYNAASRAFAELSPKALNKIKADITKAVTTAQNNKKKVVKQAAVSSGDGTRHSKQSKNHTADEFFGMSQAEQQDVMYADFQKKLARLNK